MAIAEILSGQVIPDNTMVPTGNPDEYEFNDYQELYRFSVSGGRANIIERLYPFWGKAIALSEMQAMPNKTILDEIWLAVAERQSAISGNFRGDNKQAYSGVLDNIQLLGSGLDTIQSWLESTVGAWVDYRNPINDAGDGFRCFDLASWRDAAGLNVDGFRRSTDGIIFSYGLMQKGDWPGWWVYEDIQKGLSALRWTIQQGWFSADASTDYHFYGEANVSSPPATGWSDAEAQAIAAATTNHWYLGVTFTSYSYLNHYTPSTEYAGLDAKLERQNGVMVSPVGQNARSADLYFLTTAPYTEFDSFEDTVGTQDQLSLISSFGESLSDNFAFNCGGSSIPAWPTEPVGDTTTTRGYSAIGYYLCKWNFSNQNT